MKSLKQYLPESFLRELAEGPVDSNSPINGSDAARRPNPEDSEYGHRDLNIGDPVVIVGKGINFEGKTGDIDSFGQGNAFVVVNLYNHGKHSFHSSNVEFNDYAEDDENGNDGADEDDRALESLRTLSGY